MRPLTQQRFEALVGYTRDPLMHIFVKEVNAFSDSKERVLVLIAYDNTDKNYNCIAFGRDRNRMFRCISLKTDIINYEKSLQEAEKLLNEFSEQPDEFFYQNDNEKTYVDLFVKQESTDIEKLSSSFKAVSASKGFLAAKEIINEVMPHYEDIDDGQFVKKFQTDGFDQRLWELYLFCYFNEEFLKRDSSYQAPDFVLHSVSGEYICVEATTLSNPQNFDSIPSITNREEFTIYMRRKWQRALRKKLKHQHNGKYYYEIASGLNAPFIIAIADFHTPMKLAGKIFEPPSLHHSEVALREYLYGVTVPLAYNEDGNVISPGIQLPNCDSDKKNQLYGFFNEPSSENISAVLSTAVGTIAKFNRMGKIAEFGSDNVKIIVSANVYNPEPKASQTLFWQSDVDSPSYYENWYNGVTIYHNPNAINPLSPGLLPHAFHIFLRNGFLVAEHNPELWHPFQMFNQTIIFP